MADDPLASAGLSHLLAWGVNPVGRTFQIAPGEPRPQYQIVGYVEDTKYTDLKEPFGPIGYFPAAQETRVGPYLDLIVRSGLSMASMKPSVTRSVREVVPNATVAFETVRCGSLRRRIRALREDPP